VHSASGGFRFPDGTVQTTAAGGPYANTIVVAQSGGDFTSVQAALNSITDNSAGNRYLVFVAPGTYSEQATMKEFVDIQGAGEGVTVLTAGGTGAGDVTGTLTGANNSELRFLTVENTGGSINSVAIRNNGVAPVINHVTARSSTGLLQSVAVYNDGGAAPTLVQVTATASNPGAMAAGMANVPGAPTIIDSAIRGLNGATNYGITAGFSGSAITTNIFNSRIEGSTNTIRSAAGITTRVAVSQLAGGPVDASFGPIICAGVYDESFVFSASACP
jgi:pectin methylesterase-like acyl-CoA thioesterase